MIATRQKWLTFGKTCAAAGISGLLLTFSSQAIAKNKALGGDQASRGNERLGQLAIGDEFQPCERCPTFVRVPEAPGELRRIKYVAKYPLTWKEYLRSVDENACPAPSLTYQDGGITRQASDYLDELQVDWPISILSQQEAGCYQRWLNSKVELSLDIPTAQEWNWFSMGDRAGSKFPWGNEVENPPAAVKGVQLAREDVFALDDTVNHWLISGVRIGLFPPNSWGLYDLVGNEYELTSTLYSGREWYKLHPYSFNDGPELENDVVLVRGMSRFSNLPEEGLFKRSNSVRVTDGRYSANVALRFVLLEDEDGNRH